MTPSTSALDVVTTMLGVLPKSMLARWEAASPSITGIGYLFPIAGAHADAGNPNAFVTPSAAVAA